MQIKPRNHGRMFRRGNSAEATVSRLKSRQRQRFTLLRKHWKWMAGLCSLVVLLAGTFGAGGLFGILLERKGLTDDLLEVNPVRAAGNYLKSLGETPDRIVIDIKHEHHEKLKEWRELALQRGQITSDLKQYVPAKLRFGDKVVKAELRLKGEWNDHVKTTKWSYRIKIKGGDTLMGMTSFGIQHPRTRDYSYEWFYHGALAREDVARLRYQFVAVTVNGRDLGVHALEEHLTKEMVEHNRRRQGVVVRIDADYRYSPYSDRPDVISDVFDTGIKSEHSGKITVYDEDKYEQNPALAAQVRTARNLLQAFRDGKLPTHQVFDVERMAAYFAVSELLGSTFIIDDWSDKRFLYNPITSLLEPIGLEGAHDELTEIMAATYNDVQASPDDFHTKMFSDPVFLRAYVRALDRVSRNDYVDQMLAELRPDLNRQLRILHREWPLHDFSEGSLYENAERIRAYLHPRDGMQAYVVDGQTDGTIEIGAIQPLPVEVLELVSGAVRIAAPQGLVLSGKPKDKRVGFQLTAFPLAQDTHWSELRSQGLVVRYRIMGLDHIREVPVISHVRFDQQMLAHDLMRQPPNAQSFSFLAFNETARTIRFAEGTSRVDRNLMIPAGYTLQAGPGVVIDLVDGATIVCYSPLEFTGDEEQPVILTSSDGSGQGLAVINAGTPSRLKHVVARGLSTPRQGDWQLTGAVTFHYSPVDIDHCEFRDNNSEDGLNIVSSVFALRHTHFENSPSDAVDGDFANGRITECTFHAIGGDAIDFSGSRVNVDKVRMSMVADKGISAGEGTLLFGKDIHIDKAGIGVAVKDRSEAELTDVSITGSDVGLAVFQKKPEFGPATLRIERLALNGTLTEHTVEEGSQLVIRGRSISPTHKNVKKLFYADAKKP